MTVEPTGKHMRKLSVGTLIVIGKSKRDKEMPWTSYKRGKRGKWMETTGLAAFDLDRL